MSKLGTNALAAKSPGIHGFAWETGFHITNVAVRSGTTMDQANAARPADQPAVYPPATGNRPARCARACSI